MSKQNRKRKKYGIHRRIITTNVWTWQRKYLTEQVENSTQRHTHIYTTNAYTPILWKCLLRIGSMAGRTRRRISNMYKYSASTACGWNRKGNIVDSADATHTDTCHILELTKPIMAIYLTKWNVQRFQSICIRLSSPDCIDVFFNKCLIINVCWAVVIGHWWVI